jgi:hypothetical protein
MNGNNNQSIPPFKYVKRVLGMCFPFHNFMLFCVKFFVQQIYVIINLYVLLIMEVFTRIIIFFSLNNLYKKKSLCTCDELSNGCSSYKDQILGVWVILTPKYVSFISCILEMFCMVCGCCTGL